MDVDKKIHFEYCTSNTDIQELYEIFVEILKEGNSYPQELPYSFNDFIEYFFNHKSKVIICKLEGKIAGGFYIKPNFPGKSSHIANAGYIVKKNYRGQKIGFYLGQYSLDIAKELGYKAIQFNLVFSSNIPSIKLWTKLGFEKIGIIKNAVKLSDDLYQDALIFYKSLD